ncbi:fatty acid desaturase [Chroogloeocystis siderophila]|uniref:Fatty acid desaturase n=1 Tax=Chroogloeocystis siderophila 5.2 s.c.1 TaxID=247279 RepID=A0A1U7HRX3_9CHRO|nr:fatty acid desaturase [Chroogloeocystis siderophila]OKH26298.1 fatty acid desaturase [Chroogloeocystis siderophila 5.2 s.c.1]
MTTLTTPRSIPTNEGTDIRLKDILKTLPKECFQQNQRKAWLGLLTNVLLVGLGYAGIAIAPWYLLPLFWIFTGTALTGFFVIAHDCGHRSFAKRRWVNDLVGHIFMLPLIYPFHSWRLLHNHHHLHTNKLDIDNAWQPFRPEVFANSDKFTQWGYRLVRGRFWWVGSIAHWAIMHFDWSQFSGKNRNQVKLSVSVVAIFAAIAFPALIATTGIWGFVKFWLMPWLVYHFWMSTFTLVHHTVSDVPFHPASNWNAATAQLSGTLHCNYPRWIEFLCHDINVHVPHHISTAIPSYNLRLAYSSLKENWAEYLHKESQFSWSLMQQITDECYLYDQKNCYRSFQDYHGISR